MPMSCRPTYVYGMEPPHSQRRTVWRIALQTQPVSAINNMVASLLGSEPGRGSFFLPLLLRLLRLVHAGVGLGRRRRLGRAGTRGPWREIGEEALLVIGGRHPVDWRTGAAGEAQSGEPGLCAVRCSWRAGDGPKAGRARASAKSNARMQRGGGEKKRIEEYGGKRERSGHSNGAQKGGVACVAARRA